MLGTFRNPLALLLYASLALVGAIALLLTNHPVPGWLEGLCTAGLVGGAGVMTPGLATVEKLLGAQAGATITAGGGGGAGGGAPRVVAAPAARGGFTNLPTVGLTAADVEGAP